MMTLEQVLMAVDQLSSDDREKLKAHLKEHEQMTTPREVARNKLLAAGRLVTDIHAPEGTLPLSPQELLRLGTLPAGSPSLDQLIDQDRGPR